MLHTLLLIVSFLAVGPAVGWAKPKPEKATVQNSKSTLREAEALYKKGDMKEVTALLWKNIDSLDRNGFILLLKAHKKKEEWGEVIRAANLLLSRHPKDEEGMTYLGEAQYRRQKRPDEAKETLNQVLQINRKYQPAYEILALIYENNPYERRLLYQDMIEIFGPKADFLTQLCQLNVEDGENEQGEKYCTQAIEAAPKVPENHVYLGLIAKQKGETDVAKKRLRAAALRFPQSEFAQYEQASFMEAEANWIDAHRFYDVCVKANTKSDRCWVGLGNAAVQLRKYEEAIEAFNKACQIAGRKNAPIVRRAVSTARQRKDLDWSEKIGRVAERCSYF